MSNQKPSKSSFIKKLHVKDRKEENGVLWTTKAALKTLTVSSNCANYCKISEKMLHITQG